MAAKGILDILVTSGVLKAEDAQSARKDARKKSISIEDELISRGFDEVIILKAKGEALGIPTVSLGGTKVPFDLLKSVPEDSARTYKFVPLGMEEGILVVGMIDPESISSKEALKFIASHFNQPFKIVLISNKDYNAVLDEYKGISGEVTKALGELESALLEDIPNLKAAERQKEETASQGAFTEETPITKIVAVVLKHATEGGASDVHIEPGPDQLRVRFRVDGVLYTSLLLPLKVHEPIISRVKILTNMLLDEKRRPQDGRFSARIANREIDFRVSTFPTYFGEKVAIRILDPETGIKNFDKLGLNGRNLTAVQAALARPYGLILITGPTGSGKSTTLYAMLQNLNEERWNIVSLEDPVEYSINGINQSQVRPEIDYDFAQGLRHILRQDPDVIMVGEIRDKETAQLAIHAALTGHLVLSTLHTNNALGVIPRLIDMGVDSYLIASSLALAIGQRLVRTLCDESKEEVPVTGSLKESLTEEINLMPEEYRAKIKLPDVIYKPKVTPQCPKGTRGRLAVFEVLEMTKELEKIILERPSESAIIAESKRQGMINMRQDGILKVFEGRMGMEELLEVT